MSTATKVGTIVVVIVVGVGARLVGMECGRATVREVAGARSGAAAPNDASRRVAAEPAATRAVAPDLPRYEEAVSLPPPVEDETPRSPPRSESSAPATRTPPATTASPAPAWKQLDLPRARAEFPSSPTKSTKTVPEPEPDDGRGVHGLLGGHSNAYATERGERVAYEYASGSLTLRLAEYTLSTGDWYVGTKGRATEFRDAWVREHPGHLVRDKRGSKGAWRTASLEVTPLDQPERRVAVEFGVRRPGNVLNDFVEYTAFASWSPGDAVAEATARRFLKSFVLAKR